MNGEEKISGDVKNEGYPLGEGYVDIRDLMERFIDSYINNSHRTEEARRIHDQEHRHLSQTFLSSSLAELPKNKSIGNHFRGITLCPL